jgi:two-component system, OmpR family, phosphate regulon sensor histidine kinase PhoR
MTRTLQAALVAPAVVAAATLAAWFVGGAGAALAVLGLGAAAVLGFHLWHLDRLARWAEGPLEAPVPEGSGSWRMPFTGLYRRVRTRTVVARGLAQRLERFAAAAEAIPEGIVVLDAANRIRFVNARARRHLGLDPARDLGQALGNLVRAPEVIRYLDAGAFAEPVVVASPREAGVTLSFQVVPFGDDERLLLSRDITQLEATARMRRDFIANVSHELKTPLTVVAGFVETLQDLDLDAAQRARCLDLTEEQARNMQRLVDDLLTLSALESEQSPPPDSEFPAGPLVSETAAQARALSAGRHVVTVSAADAATLLTGARDELASAFGNLVSNAIRYTPEGGTIALSWSVDTDGRGRFGVTDTGVGIAAEHIPRLTERFYRVDRSRSRATGGTGLGLAIVHHVLLRHQGELAIESEPGKGSTFAAILPASRVRRGVEAAIVPAAVTSS